MAENADLAMKVVVALVAAYVIFKIVLSNACEERQHDRFEGDEDAFMAPGMAPMSMGDVDFAAPRSAPPTVSVDLLPHTSGPAGPGDFGEFAPNVLEGQNFLDPQAFIGLNTVSGSLRNPNLSIRNEPANPNDPVGIWNVSTIQPDPYRTGLTDV